MSVANLTKSVSLFDMTLKTSGRIHSVDSSPDLTDRLESLGMCEGRTVRLVKQGEPCIVNVYGSRVGIAQELARQINVTPLSE